MSLEDDRYQAMEFYGLDSVKLEDYLATVEEQPAAKEALGPVAAAQVAKIDLDAEYEAHCVPNGD